MIVILLRFVNFAIRLLMVIFAVLEQESGGVAQVVRALDS
ncbi:MAG: hypothetical protein RIQ50_431 [Bacteroidota bacterium]